MITTSRVKVVLRGGRLLRRMVKHYQDFKKKYDLTLKTLEEYEPVLGQEVPTSTVRSSKMGTVRTTLNFCYSPEGRTRVPTG